MEMDFFTAEPQFPGHVGVTLASLQAELLPEPAGLQDPGVRGRRHGGLDLRRHR